MNSLSKGCTSFRDLGILGLSFRGPSRGLRSYILNYKQIQEEHAAQGTSPSGLRIKKVQAKGQNVDALQAKFDSIVREAEVQLLPGYN